MKASHDFRKPIFVRTTPLQIVAAGWKMSGDLAIPYVWEYLDLDDSKRERLHAEQRG